ncbi:RNB domain-containing ribonuclease [Escherichia coli]
MVGYPSRHNLEKEAPDGVATEMLDEGLVREDLTALDFVTIDSASTEDMDDALFAKALPDDKLQLIVAIADPTAWIAEGSKLDKAAKIRAFTNFIRPGFNIPMLPRELSDDFCSLRANEVRPVLACRMTLSADGTIEDNIEFFAATIESKAKLVYDQVSDWLEKHPATVAKPSNCRTSPFASANLPTPRRVAS